MRFVIRGNNTWLTVFFRGNRRFIAGTDVLSREQTFFRGNRRFIAGTVVLSREQTFYRGNRRFIAGTDVLQLGGDGRFHATYDCSIIEIYILELFDCHIIFLNNCFICIMDRINILALCDRFVDVAMQVSHNM